MRRISTGSGGARRSSSTRSSRAPSLRQNTSSLPRRRNLISRPVVAAEVGAIANPSTQQEDSASSANELVFCLRLGALEDLVDEDRRAPPDPVEIRRIGNRPASVDIEPPSRSPWPEAGESPGGAATAGCRAAGRSSSCARRRDRTSTGRRRCNEHLRPRLRAPAQRVRRVQLRAARRPGTAGRLSPGRPRIEKRLAKLNRGLLSLLPGRIGRKRIGWNRLIVDRTAVVEFDEDARCPPPGTSDGVGVQDISFVGLAKSHGVPILQVTANDHRGKSQHDGPEPHGGSLGALEKPVRTR